VAVGDNVPSGRARPSISAEMLAAVESAPDMSTEPAFWQIILSAGSRAWIRLASRRQSGGKPEGTASSSGKGVDKASREDGKEEECRLFIGQFDRDVSSAQLEKIFSAYGEVVECRVLQDKGIGFVSYARDSEAKQAVQDLHLQCVPGISRGEGLNVRTARARHTPK